MRQPVFFFIQLIPLLFWLHCESFCQASDSVIIDWLKDNAHQLKSSQIESSDADLIFLKKVLKDKRIVSMGEATHGTKEFAELKARIFKFLVLEMGFTVFALEADFAAAFTVNEYIHGNGADGEMALKNLRLFHCVNQETLKLVRWMREYNSKVKNNRKIEFYGFDLQFPRITINEIAKISAKEDSTFAKKLSQIKILTNNKDLCKYVRKEDIEMIEGELREKSKFDTTFRDKSLNLCERLVQTLWQGYRLFASDNNLKEDLSNNRDLYMKQNIDWILNVEGDDAKIMLWSHNGHASYSTVQVRSSGDTLYQMGLLLKKDYSKDLYTIGFDFNKGKFLANRPTSYHKVERAVFEVPEAPEGAFAWYLSKLNKDLLFINLTSPNVDDVTVSNWLKQRHKVRNAGGGMWDDCLYDMHCIFRAYPLSEAFDAFIFVNDAHAITPLPKK